MIGYAICGSFCTHKKSLEVLQNLKRDGWDLLPILSEISANTDTRFGKAAEHIERLRRITGNEIIHEITTAEPIGPKKMFDVLVVAPCTGNTAAKIALVHNILLYHS